METYILQCTSVFFLSLWKTYLGPALSAPYGLSYGEMLLCTVSAAMLSAATTLHFSRHINSLIQRLLPKRKNQPRFRPELRKYVRFWRCYGFYGVMALTPLLIGIPLGVWIAARLGSHKPKILAMVFIYSTLWSSVLYYGAQAGITFID